MALPRNLGNLAQGANTSGVLQTSKGGTGSTSTTFVNLTTNVTGILPTTNGGLGTLVTISGTGAITAPQVGSMIPFYYNNQAAFPSAATSHGAIAHSHADGAMYFAHGGLWVPFGFINIPQNSQSADYTLVLADSGKQIFHPSADTSARTWTIPANSSVAFPIGTAVTFINQNGAGVITISITTDTMRLAGAGTTGSRTLAANGIATCVKVTSTEWIISGTGLT